MTYPEKKAPTDVPIAELLARRWSPYAFDTSIALTNDDVHTLFEAARFAPSSYNEQPWRYVYAQKSDEGRDVIESLLMDGNVWAKNADLLIVSFAKKTFSRNDKPNHHALHDTGAATLQLVLQATAMNLVSHQMAGFYMDKANDALNVPSEYVPGSMIAIGHAGKHDDLSSDLKERETAPRVRNEQKTFVFQGKFL
jgi:nitroreductase